MHQEVNRFFRTLAGILFSHWIAGDDIDPIETGNTLTAAQVMGNNIDLGQPMRSLGLQVRIFHFNFRFRQVYPSHPGSMENALNRTDAWGALIPFLRRRP